MFFKKVLRVISHHGSDNYFRIAKQIYVRYRRDGWEGILQRLEKKYNIVEPEHTITHTLQESSDTYHHWIEQHEADISATSPLEYSPLISIITPIFNTQEEYLIDMFKSVLAQSYSNWELCLADDASTQSKTLQIVKQYSQKYPNIKVSYRVYNGHISSASNSALSLATGEYVVFLDHDDTLSPDALYEMAKKINQEPNLKLIYSDEDKLNEASERYAVHFKSAWNPDMLLSQNYICHFLLLKREIVEKVGGFREGYEGSQDHDLILRSLAYIEDTEIGNIERVLYHWRAIKGSTARGGYEKAYAHEAGLLALKDYVEEKKGVTVEDGLLKNTYKVNYPLPEQPPLVSLIIPTRDGYEILRNCIESILERTSYPNYEIIVIDNGSRAHETIAYLKKLAKHPQIRVLEYDHPFNYSALNNFGVSHAKGELVALINNDIVVINKQWLSEMVSHALRKEIGAVGAKLYYPDNTIQHAGVILGIGGVAGHAHKYFSKAEPGYFSRLKIVQNVSAVTGAALVVEKRLYEEVGGLNEVELTVAFNDVDFCLKLLQKGYRNLWTPYAELYHHESKSRGSEDNAEKVKRFNKEVEYMKERWGESLINDHYYNSNLTLVHENFAIKES
ncbi:MAG: glycosyltransferase family 2 protein [Campylobacterota bacterium]|nr:glycosyltransferase family 2 protein [Campylobacterota bacterium]